MGTHSSKLEAWLAEAVILCGYYTMITRAYLRLTEQNKAYFNVTHMRKKNSISSVVVKVSDRRVCQVLCLKITFKFISAPQYFGGQFLLQESLGDARL